MRPNIGLSREDCEASAGVLNGLLADECVLLAKTRAYRWNAEGPRLRELHELFEEQRRSLDAILDETAERVRALGFMALGTLQEFARHAALKETPGRFPDAAGMIEDLLADHETVIRQLREDADAAQRRPDPGTAELLASILRRHERHAWTLRALLAGDRSKALAA